MVDFGNEFHLDRLEWIRFGDDDVLTYDQVMARF